MWAFDFVRIQDCTSTLLDHIPLVFECTTGHGSKGLLLPSTLFYANLGKKIERIYKFLLGCCRVGPERTQPEKCRRGFNIDQHCACPRPYLFLLCHSGRHSRYQELHNNVAVILRSMMERVPS